MKFYIDIQSRDHMIGLAVTATTISDAMLAARAYTLGAGGEIVRISRTKTRGIEYGDLT